MLTVPPKALHPSMVHLVNYVGMIIIIYPKYYLHLLGVLSIFYSFTIENKDILSCQQRLRYEYSVYISRGKADSRFAS